MPIKPDALWYLPVAVNALACLVLVLAALGRKDRWILASAALVLVTANSAPVVEITAKWGWGLGTAWFLIGLVGVVLIVSYRLDVGRILFMVPNRTGLLLLWFAFFFFLLFSPLVALDRVAALRRAFSFLLIYVVGWRIFGLIFRQQPGRTRARVYTMLYAVGAWNILAALATLVVLAPLAAQGQIGGERSLISLGGITVSRLQGGFLKATGLGQVAASSLFLTAHWFRTASGRRRLALPALGAVLGLIFVWASGRTAMVAFWATGLALGLMEFITAREKTKPALFLLFFGVLPLLAWSFLAPLLFRQEASTVWQAFVQARLDSALQGLQQYRAHLLWGTGSGTLLGVFKEGDLAVESFFFRVLIEFGLIGGALYVLVWLSITLAVLRTDLHYLRQGQPGAWLPSAGFIMIWASSPAGFGFSIFDGDMALWLAIGAAAMVDRMRIKDERGTTISTR